jgi:hypothetical protein
MQVFRRQRTDRRRAIAARLAALVCLALCSPTNSLSAWETQLDDGRNVYVDPVTNRPTISSGQGSGRPLWDGVHRLSDGSTITVRSGVMVPTEQSLAADRLQALQQEDDKHPRPPAGPRNTVCDRLVLRDCGLHQECLGRDACCLARQLQALQRKAASHDPAGYRWASTQCEQAMRDTQNFPSCEYSAEVMAAPCYYLATRVCGNSNRCASSPSCRMASQLLQYQYQQAAAGLPYEPGPHNQCMQILLDHAAFPPCR